MRSAKSNSDIIQSATIISNRQIAAHTWHLRIRGEDLEDLDYIPGFTMDVFLGDPFKELPVEDRKYSIWNYEPVTKTIDLAICTFSKGKGANWIKTVAEGTKIYFKPPRGKLLLDDTADFYFLIGDVTALSHLYEINRNLPLSKKVHSFIYVYDDEDVFPDLDGSFPLNYYIVNPLSPDVVKQKVMDLLITDSGTGIAYIFGDPETCIALQHYFKNEQNWPPQLLKTKPFWKNE